MTIKFGARIRTQGNAGGDAGATKEVVNSSGHYLEPSSDAK